MKGNFRFLDFLIIIILLLTAVVFLDMFRHDLLFTFNLQNVKPIGTVVVKRNSVQRRLGDHVLWDRLTRDSPVYVWDIIRVADVSEATLYIEENTINLEENTLIRIVPSDDDEGFQIIMSYGTLSHYAEEGAGKITLEINGQIIALQPNTVLRAVAAENRPATVQTVESIAREIQSPRLLSPALNSLFFYQDDLPVLNFQWTETEDALSYLLEVSNSPEFAYSRIQRQSPVAYLTVSDLEEGTWFWRVTPLLPAVFGNNFNPSSVEFFRIQQSAVKADDTGLSISEWLAMEAPSAELLPEIPEHLIPAHFIPEPEPEPEPPPPPRVTLLAAPQNLRPSRGTNFGYNELLAHRTFAFSWSAVQGANYYIFTLSRQTAAGRQQIVRTTLNSTSYTLTNLRLLDRGNFVWQVEAVNTGRGGAIIRSGRLAESTFSLNFPFPGAVYIEDPGILYGN